MSGGLQDPAHEVSVFSLVGAIGLFRLPDFYMRLHGPTKSTTLGVGGVVVASVVFFSSQGNGLSLHELLITALLFLTAPGRARNRHRPGMLPGTERARAAFPP